MTGVLIRRRKFGHRQRHMGESHETTKVEITVMQL